MSTIRRRRLRAVAPILATMLIAPLASADQPKAPGQAQPPPPGQAPNNQTPENSAPPATPGPGQRVVKSVLQPVPAQQRYGPPRNPILGGIVDTDLTKPLSIARAVQIALQQQDAIALAQTQADAAENKVTEARGTYWPQIAPSFTFQDNLTPSNQLVITGITPQGVPIYGSISGSFHSLSKITEVTARQILWDGGLREANVGLARRTAFAAEYEVGNQRQTVIANVISSYYTVLRDQALVGVQEDNLKRAQTTLDSINAQLEVGNAAKSDTLQAISDVANAQVALLSAQNDLRLSMTSLKNAMGVVSPVQLTLSDNRTAPPAPTPDPKAADAYIKTAFFRRLDVLEQQERVNAQGYNVRIANINNNISADAEIQEGYEFQEASGEERIVSVNLSYPLFNGGSTRAAVREQKAQYEYQKRTLDQLEQNVALAVEQAYITKEVARQRVVASQAAVAAGQTNYDAALEKQRNGVINILDVLTAENALVVAQENLVSAIFDYYVADAMLQRDIGMNDPQFMPNVPDYKKHGGPPPHAFMPRTRPIAVGATDGSAVPGGTVNSAPVPTGNVAPPSIAAGPASDAGGKKP